ncbi:hypothetical protein [Vacuolonema iberomarrocanum]|uniref:hypothetical protein n=1 Tax=Vacuolonema iberomarrocanum TaxID=3454632 RepID=UPI0019F7CF32|nr:hypothetical protein [filamentous cyanobacterium LEGE 07170]
MVAALKPIALMTARRENDCGFDACECFLGIEMTLIERLKKQQIMPINQEIWQFNFFASTTMF